MAHVQLQHVDAAEAGDLRHGQEYKKRKTQMTEFKEMRRKRQQLPEEESVALLRHATSGVLSLLDCNGYPYGVPISYAYAEGKLLFHSAVSGQKIDAIRHADKASFTVICKDEVHPETFTTHFRSVICFGRVRIVDNANEKLHALRLLGERYNPGDEHALDDEIKKSGNHVAVIELDIERITGKEAIELTRMRKQE